MRNSWRVDRTPSRNANADNARESPRAPRENLPSRNRPSRKSRQRNRARSRGRSSRSSRGTPEAPWACPRVSRSLTLSEKILDRLQDAFLILDLGKQHLLVAF